MAPTQEENVPADRHRGCQLEETKTSVLAVFWAALQTSQRLPLRTKMGMPEIKSNRSHPLLCRGRRVADLVDPYYVKSATALRELTISPAILIWQRLVHLYRV